MNPQLQKVIDDCEKIIAVCDKGEAMVELGRLFESIKAIRDKHAKPLTNFEKWKAELTFRTLANIMAACNSCHVCPAQEACESADLSCYAILLAWANAEAGDAPEL